MNRNRLAVLVIVIVALLVSATAAFPSLASSLFLMVPPMAPRG